MQNHKIIHWLTLAGVVALAVYQYTQRIPRNVKKTKRNTQKQIPSAPPTRQTKAPNKRTNKMIKCIVDDIHVTITYSLIRLIKKSILS